MKHLIRIDLEVLVLALLAACQTTYPPIAPETGGPEEVMSGVELAGTSWVLSSLDGSLPLTGTRHAGLWR